MQKLTFLFLISIIFFISCFRNKKNTSVSFKENENKFEMNAVYKASRTERVDNYIQNKMKAITAFKNVDNNSNITLIEDAGAKFYVQSAKGNLHIKLNKNENSEQSYNRVKEMCEEIKEIIIQ
jgi:thiamine biosynthesis lipoprotein ApbE